MVSIDEKIKETFKCSIYIIKLKSKKCPKIPEKEARFALKK
jgi:hypothetical protein